MLEALNLCCERNGRTLFNDLSFKVEAGSLVQVTGENGAGKTTLLRMLTGLSVAESGEVRWQGQPLPAVRAHFHQHLLWIGHLPGIKSRLTARENLHFWHPVGQPALDNALRYAGLEGEEETLAGQLSAGQQRRVALARLWLSKAPLWVLDEPFTAIDSAGVEALTNCLERHARQGGMVVFTSHQIFGGTAAPLRQISLHKDAPCF